MRSLCLAFAFAAAGCAASATPETSALPEHPPLGFERTTTDGALAVRNLDASVDGAQQAVDRLGARGPFERLVDLRLTRTAFLGRFSDFDAAAAVAEASGDPFVQARVASATHEFERAAELLGTIAADDPAVVRQLGTVTLALGDDLESSLEARRVAADLDPSFENFSALAATLGALGRFDEADATWRSALAAYRDVSPFAVAWVQFQRGVMWAEQAGISALARPLYEEAVRRLPDYVVANVHLAELEAEDGDLELAIARLRRLEAWTEDPEAGGLLAELIWESDPDEAARLAEQTRERYDDLFEAHPLAFLDHGAEFFAGIAGGDPDRALALALENLEHRKDDRAWLVAIESAQAAGDEAIACELAGRVGVGRARVPLDELVHETLIHCAAGAGEMMR